MNILSELFVGAVAPESLGVRVERLNEALSPLIVTREGLYPGSMGLLLLHDWEWRETSERYEEVDQSSIERLVELVEEEPLEFLDTVPGREGRLNLAFRRIDRMEPHALPFLRGPGRDSAR